MGVLTEARLQPHPRRAFALLQHRDETRNTYFGKRGRTVGRKRKEPHRNGDVALGRSDGWWVADYRDGGPRKRSRLIRLDRPEHEARASLDKFAEARRAVVQAQKSYTVGELWKLWLEDRKKDGLSNDIYEANWVSLQKHFETRSPHLLTRDDGRQYARKRFDVGRAPATVNTELSRLRACLQWAVDTNLIAKPQKIWVPGAGKARDRVLTPEEAFKLVIAAREGDPHIYLFVVLAFSTGGRHTAILDLTWDRINFSDGTIDLEVDLPPDPMTKRKRKGRAHIVMSNLARPALEEAFSGRTKSGFVVEHGGRRLKGVGEGFYNAVKRAGLGKWNPHPEKPDVMIFETDVTPHTIRHTVATWADSKDVDTKHTAQLLGHKDENTTRKVYTHRDPSASKPAIDVIDATFETLPPVKEMVRQTKRGVPLYRALRDQKLLDRVLSRCVVDPETGCWVWQGAAGESGHGRIKVEGRLASPHRVVAYCDGAVPSIFDEERETCALHSCDNPRCCNPRHISGGSHTENMDDIAMKGKHHKQIRRIT